MILDGPGRATEGFKLGHSRTRASCFRGTLVSLLRLNENQARREDWRDIQGQTRGAEAVDGAVAAEGREEGVETKTLLRLNLYDLETFRGEGEREVIRTALRSLVWVDRWLGIPSSGEGLGRRRS